MHVTFLRSSSIGAHKICPQQFYLAYVLGLPAKAGKAASLGNVIHKTAETLAWVSYHAALGNAEYEDETFGRLRIADVTPEWATTAAYSHYKQVEDHVQWNDRNDLPQCQAWTQKLLTMSDGYFDPRNMIVVEPEKKFDLEIEEPWGAYDYETPEGRFSGQLRIKGTMDLVARDKHDPKMLEVVDYKTGRRKDWSIQDEVASVKDFKKLMGDSQLLLYYYATSRLYPDAECINFTIVFVNDGGAFRLPFGPEHVQVAKDMLRENFEKIRDTKKPALHKGPPCWTWCAFGKRSKAAQDPSQTVCNYFADQVRKKGADQVFYEVGSMKSLMSYGSGGGRQNIEREP